MMEETRKRGASIVIYVIFGILISVFVLNFGPQSPGAGQGCGGPPTGTVLSVGDADYGMNSWRWSFNTLSGGDYAGRVNRALNQLVERELLAQEAERRGLAIPDDIVDDRLKRGEVYLFAEKVDGTRAFFEDGEFFNFRMLERWIGQFGLSISTFKAEQRRELLAATMAEELGAAAHVSREEAFAAWLHQERTVTLDAVTFPIKTFRDALDATPADVAGWLAANEAEVKARYEADKASRYTGTSKRLRLRRVRVAKAPAPAAPADGAAPEATPDPGRAVLEAARADVVAGRKTLADVARALDADAAMRATGGDGGWVIPAAPGLGDPALTEAVKALAAGGEPSAVIETADAFWLLASEGEREGDLAYEQVRDELAATLASDAWARQAARAAAELALAGATAGQGKNLVDLFERAPSRAPASPPGGGIDPAQLDQLRRQYQQQLEDPDVSDEEKQQLRQILQMLESGQLGMGSWESAAIPAEATAPRPAAAPTPAAAATPAAAPGPLPRLSPVSPPQVAVVGPFLRDREKVPGLGDSRELVAHVFDQLGVGALAARVFEVETQTGPAFVVVQVTARTEPDTASFDARAEALTEQLRATRREALVDAWLGTRCAALAAKGRIKVARDVLQSRDDQGTVTAIPFTPCSGY